MNIKKSLTLAQPEVGELIRQLRHEQKLTQEQFAASLGVTCLTVNRWENARAQPSPLAMWRIETMLQELGERGQELLAKYVLKS
ncbi:MAG: helix-turn-helix transcriptional regulator [Scytonema sp. PMC 1069.18]|nr:helix-turn-helix transcriptional regulator [Scytonema sp. PMC 1069.18]MEC4886866.1 helix-turn-helix transcriptional regulator [Scytonema sp. PMC 1070.18]